LVTDLPPELTRVIAADVAPSLLGTASSYVKYQLYGTESAPAGPLFSYQWSVGELATYIEPGGSFDDGFGYVETTIDERRAVFANTKRGARQVYVQLDERWVLMTAVGLDDEVLRRIAGGLTASGSEVALKATAVPIGMVNQGGTDEFYAMSAPQISGASFSRYVPDGEGPMNIVLTVAEPSPGAAVWFGLNGAKRVDLGGLDGWAVTVEGYSDVESNMILWSRDGAQFVLTGHGAAGDQLLAAAKSVRRASETEWAEAVQAGPREADNLATVPDGTVPAAEQAPLDTQPPRIAQPAGDVAVGPEAAVKVEQPSAEEIVFSGVFADGTPWVITARGVVDNVRWNSSLGSSLVNVRKMEGAYLGFGSDELVEMVVPNYPIASSVRITRISGDRYTVALHPLQAIKGFSVAVAVVPVHDLLLVEALDKDGDVVQKVFG
jgi:hypothetical protein